MTNLWQKLRFQWPIVALAPMDGYCDSAFRCINKMVAPQIVTFSEFYSADGLKHNPKLPQKVLPHYPEEKPVIFQIFGNDPETFVIAGKIIQSYWAAGIDINMWCPAKKVVKCGYGSGLMTDRDNAFRIVNQLAENLDIPISVKTRLGWEHSEDLIEFGTWLEQAGCQLLSVHARTFKQAFTGKADWSALFDLQDALDIPVLGNGDVKNYDDGLQKIHSSYWKTDSKNMTHNSKLSGFMIGRSAIGNPWCFIWDGSKPDLSEVIKIMDRHAQMIIERKWEQRGCMEIRKHLVNYISGFDGAKEMRNRLATIESKKSFDDLVKELKIQN